MGRHAKYRNAAEKQKAYRDRVKTSESDSHLAEYMLQLIENRAQVLRNSVSYWRRKGSEPLIYHGNLTGSGYVQILINGYHNGSLETVVLAYLLERGELVEKRRDWGGIFYMLPVS